MRLLGNQLKTFEILVQGSLLLTAPLLSQGLCFSALISLHCRTIIIIKYLATLEKASRKRWQQDMWEKSPLPPAHG